MNRVPSSFSPLYVVLRDQIQTEHIVFKQKGDLYTAGLALTADACFEADYLRKNIEEVVSEIQTLPLNKRSLTYYKEAGIAYYLAKKHSIEDIDKISEYLEKTLEAVGKSDMSPQVLGSVTHFLKEYGQTLEGYDKFQTILSEKCNGFIAGSRLNAVIDLSIGMQNLSELQLAWINKQSSANLTSLDIERVAKLTIICPKEADYWEKLEHLLIENNQMSLAYPDIAFSLFEAQKIINSNIPGESLKNILDELKKVNSSWTKVITNIEDEGITINATHMHKMPFFSPNQDIWSLIGLTRAGRIKTVQVHELEYAEFMDYSRRQAKNYKEVDRHSITAMVILSAAYSIFVCLLFRLTDQSLLETLRGLSSLSNIPLLILNPWIQAVVGITWIHILYRKLITKGEITLSQILLSWPVLFPVDKLRYWYKERTQE